jgi:hypothetical protein
MMATTEKPGAGMQEQLDAAEVVRHLMEGKRITDPDLIRRIRERADRVRQAVFEKHGVVDWSVGLIREARDEA